MLKNKWFVSLLCVVGAGVLIGGGYYAWISRPVSMPETIDEAVSVINSARFSRLPDYRQEEYLQRARRLMRDSDMDRAKRREYWQAIGGNEEARETMARMMQQRMIDRALELSKMTPEQRAAMMDQRARNRPERRNRADRPEPTDQERAERRDRMKSFIQDRIQTGNPQTGGIMGEYFRMRREARGL